VDVGWETDDHDKLVTLGQSDSFVLSFFSLALKDLFSFLLGLTVLKAAQKAARSASYHDSSKYLEACERIVDFGDQATWERSRESCFDFVQIFSEVSAVLRQSDAAIVRVSGSSFLVCLREKRRTDGVRSKRRSAR